MSESNEFNINTMDRISFTKIKPYGSSGSKVVNVHDRETERSLEVITPLIFTYGAQQIETTNSAGEKVPVPNKFSMSLQFPDEERDTPEQSEFRSMMQGIFDRIKTEAIARSEDWFGRDKMNMDMVDMCFNPMFRYPKIKGTDKTDYSRAPTLPAKIPYWAKSNSWPTQVYDSNCNPIYICEKMPGDTPIAHLEGFNHVVCRLSCGGIWFANGKASVTWNVMEVVIQQQNTSKPRGECTLKRHIDPSASVDMPSNVDAPSEAVSVAHTCVVEDTDDEGEEDNQSKSEPVKAPEPAPAPVPEATPEPAPVPEATPEPAPAPKRRVRRVAPPA